MCCFKICLSLRTHAFGYGGSENVISSTRGQSSFTQMTDANVREAALQRSCHPLKRICLNRPVFTAGWKGLPTSCRHVCNVLKEIRTRSVCFFFFTWGVYDSSLVVIEPCGEMVMWEHFWHLRACCKMRFRLLYLPLQANAWSVKTCSYQRWPLISFTDRGAN